MKISALVLAMAALPGVVFAAPTVTFQGEVTDQTCTATINGATDGTVLLPTVSTAELADPGDTAGLTPFTIELTGCTDPGVGGLEVTTKFMGYDITAGGALVNMAVGGAENVAIQLTEDAGGLAPITLVAGVASEVAGLELLDGETEASYEFGAQYVSEDGSATAGAVTAVVQYTVSYL
ncbi:fimbrial protein [Stutzerimonas stutzeri]|uniref:Fimbrial protein n=1 Tax=Stutzerimonas stutzeri TaxID=316 RepID=A0A6I6LDG6_STUST|nr:fimbrial protein [Stutzerimonas stutzeri]QGZ28604.1 fimbrial protein [Stutzerimonas stutzeri]